MEKQLPKCKLTGQDGNIFNLMGIVSRTLKANGQGDKVDEMVKKVTSSPNYDIALSVFFEYVDVE